MELKHYSIIMILFVILYSNYNTNTVYFKNDMVNNKYMSLLKIMGEPNLIEKDKKNNINSVIWRLPLDSFNDKFGHFGGCDYIKLLGNPSKKWHPYPANVFVIVGKYISVPEILFGPLKYASETINIEQLVIPDKYVKKYYERGVKELSLVTGSCASITISVITLQFVIDMIKKYGKSKSCLELYSKFRKEYDKRVHNYLCGKGYKKIDWYDHNYFKEEGTVNIDKCNKLKKK